MPEIQAQHVSVYYGTNRVLEDICLAIDEHTVTSLIGPSGCGKSTFLRLFNRMNDFIPDFRLEGEYAEVFDTYVTFNADIRHTSVQVNSSAIDREDLLKILGQDADAQG